MDTLASQSASFQSKFENRKTFSFAPLFIKVLSCLPGLVFIVLFIVGIYAEIASVNLPEKALWLSITMNVLFLVQMLARRITKDPLTLKHNPQLIFSCIFEVVWLLSLVYSL